MGRSRCRATSADVAGLAVEVLLELFNHVDLSDSSVWLRGRRHSIKQTTMAQMAFVCMSLVVGAIAFTALLTSLQRRTRGRLHHQATLRIMFTAFGLYVLAASYIATGLFTGKRSKQHTITIPLVRHLLGLIGVGTPRHYISKAPARLPAFARPNLIDLGPNALPQLCFSLCALPILNPRLRKWGPTLQAILAPASSIVGISVQEWVARRQLEPGRIKLTGNPRQGFNRHRLDDRVDRYRWQCLASSLPSNCIRHAVIAIRNACYHQTLDSRTKLGTKRR